jgi:hypothetical protein
MKGGHGMKLVMDVKILGGLDGEIDELVTRGVAFAEERYGEVDTCTIVDVEDSGDTAWIILEILTKSNIKLGLDVTKDYDYDGDITVTPVYGA